VINGRFLETPPCRDKRCNGGGGKHTHWFDLSTGFMVTEPAVDAIDMPVNDPVHIRERA
jgi:hypothetical protein